jgi:hypothetical protein
MSPKMASLIESHCFPAFYVDGFLGNGGRKRSATRRTPQRPPSRSIEEIFNNPWFPLFFHDRLTTLPYSFPRRIPILIISTVCPAMANQEKDTLKQHEATPQTLEELKHTKTIDTIHNDEAIRVLAQYAGDESWTPEEEKKLVRRLDRKLISLLVITYGLQYYDKAMLSQAALFGLRDDLELSKGNRYSFSSAIFYLGFIVGSYPAILMSQRWPIERVAAGIVAVWGVCLMCSAACTNWQGRPGVYSLISHPLMFTRLLRSAFLSRISRIRSVTYVHANRWWVVQEA